MSNHLTPLQVCERLFGSMDMLAQVTGLHAKSPFVWRKQSQWRAAGDLPSTRLMRLLLTHSATHALGLEPRHLIWGANASEVAAILAARSDPTAAPDAVAEQVAA